MPSWFQHGVTYTLMWQWYAGTEINDSGDLSQPNFTDAEAAYFGHCIEVRIKSAEECAGVTTAAPETTVPDTTGTPETTAAPETTDAPETTQVPSTSQVTTESDDLVPLHGQCGGQNYSGSTTCVNHATCVVQGPYYSQCEPDDISPGDNVVALYGQCGGMNYNGPTTCTQGGVCISQGDHYSQCVLPRRLTSSVHI